jgi:hypothetical protein
MKGVLRLGLGIEGRGAFSLRVVEAALLMTLVTFPIPGIAIKMSRQKTITTIIVMITTMGI